MQFDYTGWKQAVLGSVEGTVDWDDLLEVTGLLSDDVAEEFDAWMQQIENDLDEAARRSNTGDRTPR